jgi:hypothetical protein
MKTIAVKFLTVLALASLMGGVALTAGCPGDGGSDGASE